MNTSLPITESPPYEDRTPVIVPAARHVPVAFESVPFDQGRWDAWVTTGRLADAAFVEKVRQLALLGVVVAVAAGGVWSILT